MITDIIVKRIFNYFGVPEQNGMCAILSPEYKLKQQVSIELEDGEILQQNICGVIGKIGDSTIKAIVADISSDPIYKEYVLVFQLDELSIYALQLENDANKAYFAHSDSSWVELSNLLIAKLLVGIEQLNELFVNFKPLEDYQGLYTHLIGFLNNDNTQ